MSRALATSKLHGLSREQFSAKVVEPKGKLFDLQFAATTGQLGLHGRLREVREDIAHVYTMLQERNLGIVDEPAIQKK